MSDILREWLIHQLGSEVHSLHPNNLCSKFQNGILIGEILLNYNVVSSKDFSLLVNQEDEMIKQYNFKHLKEWLTTINMTLDNDTVNGIISGQRSTIFGFLYRLCFLLECPNDLNLTEHAKKLYKSLGNYGFSNNSNTTKKYVINLPFNTQHHDQKSISNSDKSIENINTVFNEITEFESSLMMKLDSWNARGDQSHIKYLSDIKSRKEHSKIYELWRKGTISKFLQRNFDKNSCHNQKVLRNKSMPNKLNRISECEAKMLDKINSSRFTTEKRNTIVIDNKVQFNKDISTVHKKSTEVSEEMKANMKEKLIEINNRQNVIERRKLMKSIVSELVSISIKRCVYRQKYFRNVPNCIWDDWTELFIKGRPLLDTLYDSELGLLFDPNFVAENKSYSVEELKNQYILNLKDLLQYLNGTGSWSEQEIGVKNNHTTARCRVLGFLVYDVLSSLYALPASLIDLDDVMFGPVMGMLIGEIDNSLKQEICNALIKRNILPVTLEMALLYCLNAYYQETDKDELIQILENDFDLRSSLISTSKSVAKKKSQESVIESTELILTNEIKYSKQTQTPEKIDRHYESERIECGKIAFEKIYNGEILPKHHLVDCVLCYIKEKKVDDGFVLIGFSREEMIILEERIARKLYPPFGSNNSISNKNVTIIVPFKGPDLSDEGRYKSSFTSCLKILPYDYPLEFLQWDDMMKYYRSQSMFTLLQTTEKNISLDAHKVELLCKVLTGQTVKWSEELNWIKCIHDMHQEEDKTIDDSFGSDSFQPKVQENEFKRERLHGKSEFDFIDHMSSMKSNLFSNAYLNVNTTKTSKIFEVQSILFNVQLTGNIGIVLGNYWKSLENEFVENMKNCFFHRRILISEEESYVGVLYTHLNEILNRPNIKKIELVKLLQSDLFKIPDVAFTNPDVIRQSLLAVSSARSVLINLTNKKIETCRQLIENEKNENWLDKQMTSLIMTYKVILQIEVDRTLHTLLFINSYMSKLFNQKLPISIIPKPIEVTLWKDVGSKVKAMVQNTTRIEEFFKKFNTTIAIVAGKLRNIFSTNSEWLEEIKEAQHLEPSEKSFVYLKIWKFVIEWENLRTANQLKIILARFHLDIKELENGFIQFRLDMNQRVDNRLRHELNGIDRIYSLFETAINERLVVRYEIILVDDWFYLNLNNVLCPNKSPPEPFQLLESENEFAITIDELKIVTAYLDVICQDGRISIVDLSSSLLNHIKYFPHIEWLNRATLVLRTMFGFTVNYVDWPDFVIHCLELPHPSIDELLDLNNQYMQFKEKKTNCPDQNHIEGFIDKDDFDSISLWYQKTLPSPSINLRYIKIKDLLFNIFSIDGKLDYIAMLLAFCKDECPVKGLIKAISLVMNQKIMLDQSHSCNYINEEHSIQLSLETLYKTLIICLKNYMAPDRSDIEILVSSILKTHSDMRLCYGNTFSVMELIQHNGFYLLSKIGYRFNSRPLSSILNSLN